MFKDRYAIRAAAGLLAIVMLLASGTAVYGFEGGEYHEFRGGDINIYLPEGWVSEESYAHEAEDGGAGIPEEIFTAWDESGNSGLELSVYYVMEEAQTDDYFYIDGNEAEALEYYDEYGIDAIVDVWLSIMEKQGGAAASSSIDYSEKEFFDGQWNGFLVTDVTAEAEYMSGERKEFFGTCYLTVRMADDGKYVVTNALVFQNDGNTALTEAQSILAGEIADEFYDHDYYNVMAGIDLSDFMFGDEAASGFGDDDPLMIIIGIVGVLAPLVVIAAVVVIVVKRVARRTLGISRISRNFRSRQDSQDKGAKSFSAGFTGTQQSFDLGDTIGKFKKRRAEKTSFSGREQQAEKRTERREERRTAIREERRTAARTERRSTLQMRSREAESAEQRYYESLQTLHKTGLLTKDEMRDMLQRHERSRARQPKR